MKGNMFKDHYDIVDGQGLIRGSFWYMFKTPMGEGPYWVYRLDLDAKREKFSLVKDARKYAKDNGYKLI